MGLEPPRRAQYIRLLVGELQRIASHLIGIGAYVNDLGTTTPLLWTMRDREGIMDLFEALGGSRFNVNYVRVGGVLHDFPTGLLRSCEAYLDQLEKNMGELVRLVNGNDIFQARTQGVGYLDPQQALAYGLSGPTARASGITWVELGLVPHDPLVDTSGVIAHGFVDEATPVIVRIVIG